METTSLYLIDIYVMRFYASCTRRMAFDAGSDKSQYIYKPMQYTAIFIAETMTIIR